MCVKKQVITTRNGNSNLKLINKITKARCSLKGKGLHSDLGYILSNKCLKCLLTLSNNGVMIPYLF